MPSSLEVANLVAAFTSDLDAVIDRMVAERFVTALDEFRLTVFGTAPQRTRSVRRTHVARGTPVPVAAPPPRPLPVALPKARTATVIPSHVPITRLPPGPVPKQHSYSALRSQCRLPGCLTKNSGPRFDYFCRDHYAVLNRDEREKYKAQWKAASGSQNQARSSVAAQVGR
jgi:hypothetical protein